MRNREPLDEFGRVLMEHLRDKAIGFYDILAQGQWKAPALQELQSELGQLDEQQRTIIRRCVMLSVDNALHDFLFRIQEDTDCSDEGRIQIVVNSVNIATLSDGLHGELFGESGWMSKYSAYGEEPEFR